MVVEPKYDEDVVNLGYLKKIVADPEGNIENIYENVSKHYASKPQPPYHKGDTWIDGNIIYTCINDREIGTYQDSDWTTESGAREEAEKKNKVFLRQPSNYSVGDMWILQSDEDHRAGKKGEMLISTAGRKEYDSDDWINMLGYGTIRSINEVANNINDALKRLKIEKEEGIITIFYSNAIPENPILNDLWYVTESIDEYSKEKLYKYNGDNWELIKNNLITVAFEEANQDRLISDGKIQSFYTDIAPLDNIGVGDIWNDTTTKKLYRYNGTNWIAVYDTNINEIRKNVETVTETTVQIQTDLGGINQRVNSVETTITTLGQIEKAEGKEITVDASSNPAKLYCYGNTEQETRSGKNLLNLKNTQTSSGITSVFNNDSSVTISGTATANWSNLTSKINQTIPAGTYTFSTKELKPYNIVLRLYRADNTYKEMWLPSNTAQNNMTLTEEFTGYYVFIQAITKGETYNETLYLQLEQNSKQTDWQPYGAMPSPDYPSDIRNLGDNINLFDKNTIIKTGKYHMNGTEQTNSKYFYNKVRVKGINKLSYNGCKNSSGSNVVIFDFYDNNDTFISCAWYKTTSDTVSVPDNATYCYFSYLYSEIDTIKIEQGSTPTSYSPYSYGSVGIKVQNKNIFDLGKRTQSSLLGVVVDIDGSEITFNGTTTGYGNLIQQYGDIASYAHIGKFKAGTYYINRDYISGTYTTTGASSCYIRDKNKKEIFNLGIQNSRGTKITLTEDTDLYLQVYCNKEGTIFDNYKISFQIEKGEEKTQYEKHQSRIYSFPLAEGQVLHKEDYLAEDGIHQVRNKIVLEGTESWYLSGTYTKKCTFSTLGITNIKKPTTNSEDTKSICSHFSRTTATKIYNGTELIAFGIGTDGLYFNNNNDSLANFKTYLAEQYTNGTPVTIEHELAEEVIIPYTPEQQKVLDSIETFKGINHIYCIDEIQPEKIILTYYPNTPYNDTLINKDTFDKVTTEMNAEFNIRANEVETTVREQTTASIMTLLNNNYLTGEQVNALVNGNAEDIATVKEQLTQTVTSSQMQIEITKAIEGGVSYLKNTLFTIDENGMAIATSEDEFNALYNNKGMYLYSFEELIARFDIDGSTIQGNLTLEGEFITPNLRMMNVDVDEVPHTHIHWIGG